MLTGDLRVRIMSINRATATGHRSTLSQSHSPGGGNGRASDRRFEEASGNSSRATTPVPISSISKRGTVILGSGRSRRAAGAPPVLGRRSNLRGGSSFSAPGTPPQHSSTDGGASMADVIYTAELASTSREVVFAQSDEMSVTFSDDLPTEVRGVIGRGGTCLHA